MQTITTKYHCATNYRGERISATTSSGERIYVAYDYSLGNNDDNHCQAAQEFKDKLKWQGEMVGGSIKTGMVFVFVAGSPMIK